MDKYIVSARKYRPATFASVVGQKALTGTLRNAVLTHRLASSYLFCGGRGVGKTTCARIFAKAINCENPGPDGEPCNECAQCRDFNNGTSMNIVELDAASNNGVDHIRGLIEKVQVPPSSGKYRVFIVDEVHMLSAAAFNAFLKTLEEPPAYVVFILATTEKHKIIPTILSRCQIYDFHRITIPDMVDHMAHVAQCEGITADPAALTVIAHKADGAMRDALSIFDQVAASSRGNITYQSAIDNLNVLDRSYYNRLLERFLDGDVLGSWMIYKEVRDRGFDSLFFVNGLADYLRDILAASTPATLQLIEAGDDERQALAQLAAKCKPTFLLRAMDLCNDCDFHYRTSSGKQFLVELTLAKICQPAGPSPESNGKGEGQLQPIAPASAPSTPAGPAPRADKPQTPTPTPTPTPSPTYTPPPAPQHQRTTMRTTLRTPNISINPGRRNDTPADEPAAAPAPAQQNTAGAPFTDHDLTNAWRSFIASIPTEHVLANTMLSSEPVPSEPGTYCVTVQNEFQQTEMLKALPRITAHLHSTLHNSAITITVAINQGEKPRHTLNDRDFLRDMAQNNPMLKKYIEGFRLKL